MSNSPGLAKRPLYLQVHDLLSERIAAGVWRPGASLPNELDLAQELGVSIGTVRKALEQLEADQLVARKQGRGTFVVDHTSAENICRFIGLRDKDGQRVAGVGKMLAQSVRRATAEERDRLRLAEDEQVVFTKRLRRHRGRPLLVEERCLASSRFPGLVATALGDYLIIELAQKCGLHLAKAVEDASLSEATAELAGLLSIGEGTALLKLDRVLFLGEGLPVERRIAFCHLQDEYYLAEMR